MCIEDEIKQLLVDVNLEISDISIKMNEVEKNKEVFLYKLKSRLAFLKWITLNWNIRYEKPGPKIFKQKEVFYCNLGNNIGNELNGQRPVIIMQNDIGNAFGNTTIIVPVTSYENSEFFEKDGDKYISYIKNGKTEAHKLDFYEIPIIITPDSTHKIYGCANVVHMREISKKRLANIPIAKITEETYDKIVEAIVKNLKI